MEALPHFNVNAETTLQMDTSKKGPGANLIQKGKDIPVTDTFSQVTPMDPEDDIQLPFRKTNMIATCNSTCILMSVQSQDSFSNKLDQLRKSTVQGNQLTRLSPYINTRFLCDKKSLPADLHKCWNHRETLSTLSIVSRTFIMLNTNMSTICMITIQHLMSEHFSDSIFNRSAQTEKNTLQKKYITRLKGHNTDQLCDRESLPTDLPESWPYKELLHNRYGLINHGYKIIPVIYKELYILPRPLKAMAQWKFQHITQKEVHILSRPLKLKPMLPDCGTPPLQSMANCSIASPLQLITQRTLREKDLPQLPSTLGAQEMYETHQELIRRQQHKPEKNYIELTPGMAVWVQHRQITSWEPATVVSQSSSNSYWIMQENGTDQPRVYRRTRSMLKIRCTDIRQPRHNYSQSTELEKAKFQTPSTSSTILLRKYHRILSTRQNQILLLLLYFQNQKKGRKLQQMFLHLQTYLHLHPHWRQLRNSPTL